MLATSLYILTIAHVPDESIRLRTFSLVNTKGQSVFHKDFDRRRLADTHDHLALKFHAEEKEFEFELQRSRSILAPDATIKLTGNVRNYQQHVHMTAFLACQPAHVFATRAMAMWNYPRRRFYRIPALRTTRQLPSLIAQA